MAAIHAHLLSLLRIIVHHGHAGKSESSTYLREVAEAFMDCQAVQGRVIERIGLEIQGVTSDFRGLLVKLVGDYKGIAVKMLTLERIAQRKVADSGINPTHYENRLIADLGGLLGFNQDDVRRAQLDEHAASRFQALAAHDRQSAAERCKELFDIDAVLQAFMAEVTTFDSHSLPESLPCMFLCWASGHMKQKHLVFDEETCSHIDVNQPLALAIFESLFLGELAAAPKETYRGYPAAEVFLNRDDCGSEG